MSFYSESYLGSLPEDRFRYLLATTSQVGTHPETRDWYRVPTKDRYSGTYILGVQGAGKSALLENLILQDIQNNQAVIAIDPHDDLTQNCIAQLPDGLSRERLEKIYLLDMEDEEYPFGINVFRGGHFTSSIALGQAINRVRHIFEVQWPEITKQQHLPKFLLAATIVLFANPGATLVDMYRLLKEDTYRQQMLKNVTDPTVLEFWRSYDELSPALKSQQVEPLTGRLEWLFMGRSLVRNIVGQSQTTIDFRRAIENKQIIFIKLPVKSLGDDARLIGTMLLAQIHEAIFSFANVPEPQRPGFSLYVDEFQHFATPDFNEMFTEGRKFGVRVTVAHQYRSQLPGFLQASTMTARNIICFRTTPEDSREMAHHYVGGEASVRPEDIDPRPVEHLLHYGSNNFAVQTFIDWYLLPMQSQKRNGSVEITHPGVRWEHAGFWVMNVEAPKEKPKVADPTHYLNNLLYQVMKTGNPTLQIPSEIVYGFANCGRGFYSVFNRPFQGKYLTADVRYPAHLVVGTGSGSRWTRAPEDSKEQLYHFLFHLRATMSYLAAHPIGKKSSLNPADIAQMLTQLPRRAAFVRSGDDVGVIYTDNTLPHMDEDTVLGKYVNIKLQTRQKYCRKVEDSQSASPNTPDDEPPISGWEEVR